LVVKASNASFGGLALRVQIIDALPKSEVRYQQYMQALDDGEPGFFITELL